MVLADAGGPPPVEDGHRGPTACRAPPRCAGKGVLSGPRTDAGRASAAARQRRPARAWVGLACQGAHFWQLSERLGGPGKAATGAGGGSTRRKRELYGK